MRLSRAGGKDMIKKLIILVVIWTSLSLAQNYRIDWWVIGAGGGHSQSGSYQLDGTIGQPIVGSSSSPNYLIDAGFWVGAAPEGGCDYIPGDANNNAQFNGVDVTYSVNYLKGVGAPPPFECDCPPHGMLYAAADANGNCQFNGVDVTYSVNYLKGLGPNAVGCSDCPPAGMAPSAPTVVPASAPTLITKGKIAPHD